jgi:plastocyanin
MPRAYVLLLPGLLAFASVALVLSGDQVAGTTGPAVFVNNNAFCAAAGAPCAQPLTTQIDPGQTVTWLDGQAGSTHSVTHCLNSNWTGCDGTLFDSGIISDPPTQYTAFTFTDPGTYHYHCDVHSTMRGIVQVGLPSVTPTASPTPSPAPTATPTPSPTPAVSPTPATSPTPTTSSATPSPSPTPTPASRAGDVNCDGLVDESDAFEILEYLALGNAEVGPACADIGTATDGRVKGDVDCDGQVSPADSLLVLLTRSGATLPPLPSGCPGP